MAITVSRARPASLLKAHKANSILRGIAKQEIWVPTDVYEVRLPQPSTCHPLVLGQVLAGMHENDPAQIGKPNEPMLPVAWTNSFTSERGKTARVFATTMGSAVDFQNEALRRLFVDAALWCVGRESKIPSKADVTLVGNYRPRFFLDEEYDRGLRPLDLQ